MNNFSKFHSKFLKEGKSNAEPTTTKRKDPSFKEKG